MMSFFSYLDLTDLFIAIGEVIFIISCLSKDMLMLRFVMNIGLAFYIAAGIHAGFDAPGMKALIFFSMVSFIANFYRIIQIFGERNVLLIPPHYKIIYEKNFSMMNPGEFLKLQKLVTLQTAPMSSVLIDQDEYVKDLMLITKGQVKIIIDNKVKTILGPHFYVGEMSFLSGEVTAAKIVATEDLELMVWPKAILSKLEHDDTNLYIHLTKSIVNNLICKIKR